MMQKLKRARVSMLSHATRKQGSRETVHKKPVSAFTKPDHDRRSHERGALKIPVRLRTQGKEVSGRTHDLSPAGLRFISGTELHLTTPMALQFCFGGETCYAQVAGQVVFCRKLGHDPHVKYEIGIKFSDIREWEQRILNSAVQVLREDAVTRDKSFLTIRISEDHLAKEAANLSTIATTPDHEGHYRAFKRGKKLTPHPAWILDLRQHLEPTWNAILNCRLLQEASAGTLSLPQMRAWLTQLYPFIETFPKWIALNIPKTQDDISRGFLIDNIRVEKRHAEQWVYMAEGFGIKRADLYTVKPLPEVDALTHWLWSINTQGSLAEAVGATNYAIEGITQEIAKLTVKGFPHYEGVDGIHLEKKAYWWMEAHAKYDDLHPQQALEIMKMYATTKELQDKVTFVTRRSLEYMLMGFETCYTQFQPQGAATLTLAI
jgi:pyrroloquinoline quinone (PQQ) biosynthesis protein C